MTHEKPYLWVLPLGTPKSEGPRVQLRRRIREELGRRFDLDADGIRSSAFRAAACAVLRTEKRVCLEEGRFFGERFFRGAMEGWLASDGCLLFFVGLNGSCFFIPLGSQKRFVAELRIF